RVPPLYHLPLTSRHREHPRGTTSILYYPHGRNVREQLPRVDGVALCDILGGDAHSGLPKRPTRLEVLMPREHLAVADDTDGGEHRDANGIENERYRIPSHVQRDKKLARPVSHSERAHACPARLDRRHDGTTRAGGHDAARPPGRGHDVERYAGQRVPVAILDRKDDECARARRARGASSVRGGT